MKKKKILLIVLPIIFVIIVLGLLAILYFTTDMFKSNEQLFSKYFVQNGELFSMLENENTKTLNEFKKNNTYNMTGDLTTTLQDGSNVQEIKATTAARHDTQTGRTYSELTLKNGDADTLKFSYINSEDIYAIKCDDIIANYIGIRNNGLNQFMQNMGVSDVSNVPSSVDFTILSSISDITEEQKQHIINTYSKTIQESISKDKYTKIGKKDITVGGANYNTNAYKVEIDGDTLKQIVTNCLTTLKDDNATLVVLSNKFAALGLDENYTDITKISNKVSDIITKIQQDNSNDTNISITVYENKGKNVRTEIELNENNTEEILSSDNIIENSTQTVQENTTNNTYNITIDTTTNGSKKNADITILSNKTKNSSQGTSNDETNTMQISLSKSQSDSRIINEITVIPNTNNAAQTFTVTTTIGSENGNSINNSSDVTANISSDGINVQTIQSSYNQTIEKAEQVNEIMELKNSNTVIANNYSKEQLLPFLGQVVLKAQQVIPAKFAQLGIDLSNQANQNVNGSVASENATYKLLAIIATSSTSIINANGFNISDVGIAGMTGIAASIMQGQSNIGEMTIDTAQ